MGPGGRSLCTDSADDEKDGDLSDCRRGGKSREGLLSVSESREAGRLDRSLVSLSSVTSSPLSLTSDGPSISIKYVLRGASCSSVIGSSSRSFVLRQQLLRQANVMSYLRYR
jgi:hypothetical protein